MSLPASKPSSGPDEARWFEEEVQPHEPTLRAYLHHKFPSLSETDDVVQESYLRILQARVAGTLRSPRGFLFTVARNLALDMFRRRQTVSLEEVAETGPMAVLEDGQGLAEIVSREQEIKMLAEAIESLPRRCRQVLKLRKIYNLSHREIAERLGISERTVNVQVGKGVSRCAEYLQARGMALSKANGRTPAQPPGSDEG